MQASSLETTSEKESVSVSPANHVYTLRKKRKIKTVSVLTRFPYSLDPWRSLSWVNDRGRENTFGVDCKDDCTQKQGGEKLLKYRKGVLVQIVRMNLWISKDEIGRWMIAEMESRFLVEILGVMVCASRVVKMKEHLLFCRKFRALYIQDRIVADQFVKLWKGSGS